MLSNYRFIDNVVLAIAGMKNQEMKPFGILLALEEETFLKVVPQSHDENIPFRQSQLLKLKRGQFVIFDPIFIHAGFGYNEIVNVRLHGYVFRECLWREAIDVNVEEGITGTYPIEFEEHLCRVDKKKKSNTPLLTRKKDRRRLNARRNFHNKR